MRRGFLGMYRHATRYSVAIAVVFAALVVGLGVHGRRGRTFVEPRTSRTVSSPLEAYRLWKAEGVRGRILVLFDRYPHFHTSYEEYRRGAPPSDSNFVEVGVFENVVRKLYLVVPDAEWEEVERNRQTYQRIREGPGKALYLDQPSGISLVATTASALPRFGEDVLVYVNGDRFDPREATALLARKGIASDLLVVLERGARR